MSHIKQRFFGIAYSKPLCVFFFLLGRAALTHTSNLLPTKCSVTIKKIVFLCSIRCSKVWVHPLGNCNRNRNVADIVGSSSLDVVPQIQESINVFQKKKKQLVNYLGCLMCHWTHHLHETRSLPALSHVFSCFWLRLVQSRLSSGCKPSLLISLHIWIPHALNYLLLNRGLIWKFEFVDDLIKVLLFDLMSDTESIS